MSMEVTSVASSDTTTNSNVVTNQTILAKDDFLKLLITQMQYQDPMNPMESQEFASQLAQFSTVEQLENIDENLNNSLQLDLMMTQAISNTLATTFIGQEAKGYGNYVLTDQDGNSSLSFDLSEYAADCQVTITNSRGETVRTLTMENVSEGEHQIDWDLKNDAGETLPNGEYQFSVSATNLNGDEISAEEMMVGNVTGVRYVEGSAMMMIADREISFSMVYEIGEIGDE